MVQKTSLKGRRKRNWNIFHPGKIHRIENQANPYSINKDIIVIEINFLTFVPLFEVGLIFCVLPDIIFRIQLYRREKKRSE